MGAMTHSYVWHDSFICVTTHSYVWHDSFICVLWLIHMCAMTHSYVCHDSFICVPWLPHTCAITHQYVCWFCHGRQAMYRVTKNHRMPQVAGHFSRKSHYLKGSFAEMTDKASYDSMPSCTVLRHPTLPFATPHRRQSTHCTCSTLQHPATPCNTLQQAAISTLQHPAAHCNTM